MTGFTATQGRYLSFIQAHINLHGYPPAESEIAAAMCVSPASVNQMVKKLEKEGLILRQPGQARSIEILIPEEEIPPWNKRGSGGRSSGAKTPTSAKKKPNSNPSARLYVLMVYITGGPLSDKYANKEFSRVIEIRGDQTLEDLHRTIFKAFDRFEEHLYEFQFGKRPSDPKGPNFGIPDASNIGERCGDARTTKLDDLDLTLHRTFGYWFDFGDDWHHQIQVEKIEVAIPTVPYPRITKRKGKSPPQYENAE